MIRNARHAMMACMAALCSALSACVIPNLCTIGEELGVPESAAAAYCSDNFELAENGICCHVDSIPVGQLCDGTATCLDPDTGDDLCEPPKTYAPGITFTTWCCAPGYTPVDGECIRQ
jgi:hypothetical protein